MQTHLEASLQPEQGGRGGSGEGGKEEVEIKLPLPHAPLCGAVSDFGHVSAISMLHVVSSNLCKMLLFLFCNSIPLQTNNPPTVAHSNSNSKFNIRI